MKKWIATISVCITSMIMVMAILFVLPMIIIVITSNDIQSNTPYENYKEQIRYEQMIQ